MDTLNVCPIEIINSNSEVSLRAAVYENWKGLIDNLVVCLKRILLGLTFVIKNILRHSYVDLDSTNKTDKCPRHTRMHLLARTSILRSAEGCYLCCQTENSCSNVTSPARLKGSVHGEKFRADWPGDFILAKIPLGGTMLQTRSPQVGIII